MARLGVRRSWDDGDWTGSKHLKFVARTHTYVRAVGVKETRLRKLTEEAGHTPEESTREAGNYPGKINFCFFHTWMVLYTQNSRD